MEEAKEGGPWRLTRHRLRDAAARAAAFVRSVSGRDGPLERIGREQTRDPSVYADISGAVAMLDVAACIQFLDNTRTDEHWAETDGSKIWLNDRKDFDEHSLFWTLAHEALHGVLRRPARGLGLVAHTLSEEREHAIMARIDGNLV